MTVETPGLVLDPYDYDFHEDPYPTNRGCVTRLRCTATTS
ncbi:hypothetical protein I553_0023 [Mycobacterium xenopi 4042]|uniref:Uncharacterized protein n=1 Tax=Mycobacterium xenopi 4042 TaxID=1299334 RepID=X8CUY9_MYCXE|nr:hypothetical protein I553_0023 [Mycobacterium xenopi 4042]